MYSNAEIHFSWSVPVPIRSSGAVCMCSLTWLQTAFTFTEATWGSDRVSALINSGTNGVAQHFSNPAPKGTFFFSSVSRDFSKMTDTKQFPAFKTATAQTLFYLFSSLLLYQLLLRDFFLIILVDTASGRIHSLSLFNVTAPGLDLCLFKKEKVSLCFVFSSV